MSNDGIYLESEVYTVRYITKKPDPEIPKALKKLPRVSFDTHYVAENLHHFMFTFRGMLQHKDTNLDLSMLNSSFLGGNND